MQILIWKAYGDIDVYCAETPTQLEGILSDVIDCVKYVTSIEDIPIIDEYRYGIQNSIDTEDLSNAKLLMLKLIEEHILVGNNESFEYFYFDKVKYA